MPRTNEGQHGDALHPLVSSINSEHAGPERLPVISADDERLVAAERAELQRRRGPTA